MTVLAQAAEASLHAPSVFNTQPWTWRVAAGTLESALLLPAAADGVATAPISDAIVVE